MKFLKFAILPLTIASSSAFAEPHVYFSGMVGMSNVDLGISSSTLTTIDEEDTSLQGIVGIHAADNVSIEAHYANLGEASVSIRNGGSITANGSTISNTSGATLGVGAEATSLGVAAMVHGSSDNDVIPFAKLGWHSWDLDVPVSVNGVNVATLSEDGSDMFYGAGLMWKMSEGLALRAEYTGYEFDSDRITNLSAGIVINF